MRLLLAGLFVFVAPIAAIVWLPPLFEDRSTAGVAVMLLAGAAAVVIALWIFNVGATPGFHESDPESQPFITRRAFQFADLTGESVRYFIELAGRSVLYLNGQYLYEYEAIETIPN